MTSKTLRRFLFVMGQNKQLHLFDPRTRGLSEPAKFFFMQLRGLFARKQISKKTLITVFCRYVVSVSIICPFFYGYSKPHYFLLSEIARVPLLTRLLYLKIWMKTWSETFQVDAMTRSRTHFHPYGPFFSNLFQSWVQLFTAIVTGSNFKGSSTVDRRLMKTRTR